MGEKTAPGPQEQRFAAYIEGLAEAAGHADRRVPLRNYCTGLLLPGERKSVEPMAARLDRDHVQRMHQSLHHLVADAPWSDEAVLDRCLDFVIPAMLRRDPVVAWVVDDTGFPRKVGSAPAARWRWPARKSQSDLNEALTVPRLLRSKSVLRCHHSVVI